MEPAIQRVISEMWARYVEPIKLDDLASTVFISPFHFLRVFTKATGVTPGKYLSAIRMYEAKHLLLTTSLRVSDIVSEVGYNSVGTFTTRFTNEVGMTPSQYREPGVGELLVAVGPRGARVPSVAAVRGADLPATIHDRQSDGASIVGTVELPPEAAQADVLVCVFRESVPQRAPVAHRFLPGSESGGLALHGVPPGRVTLVAVAESRSDTDRPILVSAQRQPVVVTPGEPAEVHLRLRRPAPTDLPLAFSLATRVAQSAGRVTARHRAWREAV